MKSIDLPLLEGAMKDAGLKQEEVAELFGVSRQTLFSWRKGKPASNDFLVDRAEKLCVAIKNAVAAGKLPLSDDVALSSRMIRIKGALLNR